MIFAPQLLKIFTGIETSFTQNVVSTVFNTTFLAVSIGITYLSMNPLTKAVYVLRCFYGESIYSGDDLKLGIRARRGAAATAAASAGAVVACPSMAGAGRAADARPRGKDESEWSLGDWTPPSSACSSARSLACRLPRQ